MLIISVCPFCFLLCPISALMNNSTPLLLSTEKQLEFDDMQRHILILITCLLAVVAPAQNKVQKSVPTIYVDAGGVMRWSDTKKEASFFGVNYTLPFAHAYRAMGYLGVDRKAAIDRDVYHMARLGLNAYRIHVWDVEISDAEGNLLESIKQ